jgi:hypothetical protein
VIPVNGTGSLIVADTSSYQGYANYTFSPFAGKNYVITLQQISKPKLSLNQHSIGYIGCSESALAVEGYGNMSDGGLFWPNYQTGRGVIYDWSNSSSNYWSLFDQELATYGQPQEVWIQVCVSAATVSVTSYQTLLDTLEILRSKVPSATFYISPIQLFDPPYMCSITQTTGVPYAFSLVSQGISNGLAKAGPDLGPLAYQLMGGNICDPKGPGGQS